MNFSFIKEENNKIIFPKLINAGIYKESDIDNISGKPWGNNYYKEKIEPDAELYANQFYAKNHIPSSFRPGNNPRPKIFEYIDTEKFNTKCYKL